MVLKYRKKEIHLRNHLFWDVDVSKVRPGANKKMIIERVITRGTLFEFMELQRFYTKKEIKETVLNCKSFSLLQIGFLSDFYQVPKKDFKGYKIALQWKKNGLYSPAVSDRDSTTETHKA